MQSVGEASPDFHVVRAGRAGNARAIVVGGSAPAEGRARSAGRVHHLHLTVQIEACCVARFRFLRVRIYRRVGSVALHRYGRDARGMSAVPPIATESVPRNKTSLCAKTGLMHRSKRGVWFAMLHSITSLAPASSALAGSKKAKLRRAAVAAPPIRSEDAPCRKAPTCPNLRHDASISRS